MNDDALALKSLKDITKTYFYLIYDAYSIIGITLFITNSHFYQFNDSHNFGNVSLNIFLDISSVRVECRS